MTFSRFVYLPLDHTQRKTETVLILVTPPCQMGHAEKKEKTMTKNPTQTKKKKKKEKKTLPLLN